MRLHLCPDCSQQLTLKGAVGKWQSETWALREWWGCKLYRLNNVRFYGRYRFIITEERGDYE